MFHIYNFYKNFTLLAKNILFEMDGVLINIGNMQFFGDKHFGLGKKYLIWKSLKDLFDFCIIDWLKEILCIL